MLIFIYRDIVLKKGALELLKSTNGSILANSIAPSPKPENNPGGSELISIPAINIITRLSLGGRVSGSGLSTIRHMVSTIPDVGATQPMP